MLNTLKHNLNGIPKSESNRAAGSKSVKIEEKKSGVLK